jgi:hypothetical protein
MPFNEKWKSLGWLLQQLRQLGDIRRDPLGLVARYNKGRWWTLEIGITRRIAMKLSLFFLGVFAALVCLEKPAAAQSYPWCAYYDVWQGATNCGFSTIQQCLAAVSGGWRELRAESHVSARAWTISVN